LERIQVSRFFSRTMKEVETHTLAEVKKRDPWLELTWQDFVELCETHEVDLCKINCKYALRDRLTTERASRWLKDCRSY
jgi:hypothetical protein